MNVLIKQKLSHGCGKLMITMGWVSGRRGELEIGTDRWALLYIKGVTNEDLPCTAGNPAQHMDKGLHGKKVCPQNSGYMYTCSQFTSLYTWNWLNIVNQPSVQFNCSVVSSSLWSRGLQHARLPCLSPVPGVCSHSCPLSRWCHPATSFSVIPFSSWINSSPIQTEKQN